MIIAKEKIDSVKEYLCDEFQDDFQDELQDYVDRELVTYKGEIKDECFMFQVSDVYTVIFNRLFFDSITNIKETLQKKELSEFMKKNKGKKILVTTKEPHFGEFITTPSTA